MWGQVLFGFIGCLAPLSPRASPAGTTIPNVAVATRRDIDRQRQHDRHWPQNLSLLGVRVRAVAEAQRATLTQQEGAAPALRQSLVDLAACAEAVADDLEPVGPTAGR